MNDNSPTLLNDQHALPRSNRRPGYAEAAPTVKTTLPVTRRATASEPSLTLVRCQNQAGQPASVGPYAVFYRLAEGQMSSVFMGGRFDEQQGDSPPVVIKLLHPEATENIDFLRTFLDERALLARLDHPHVVRLVDHGKHVDDQGRLQYYLVLEYVDGQSLSAAMNQKKSVRIAPELWLAAAARIGIATCNALHYTHQLLERQGRAGALICRDVTLDNLFLTYDGTVKLSYLNVAAGHGSTRERGGQGPDSPDQPARQRDVLCVGALLWQLALGCTLTVPAAEAPRPSLVSKSFPRPLERVIEKALGRDPDGTYQSAAELALDLQDFLGAHQELWTLGDAPVAQLMQRLFLPDRTPETIAPPGADSGQRTVTAPANPAGGTRSPTREVCLLEQEQLLQYDQAAAGERPEAGRYWMPGPDNALAGAAGEQAPVTLDYSVPAEFVNGGGHSPVDHTLPTAWPDPGGTKRTKLSALPLAGVRSAPSGREAAAPPVAAPPKPPAVAHSAPSGREAAAPPVAAPPKPPAVARSAPSGREAAAPPVAAPPKPPAVARSAPSGREAAAPPVAAPPKPPSGARSAPPGLGAAAAPPKPYRPPRPDQLRPAPAPDSLSPTISPSTVFVRPPGWGRWIRGKNLVLVTLASTCLVLLAVSGLLWAFEPGRAAPWYYLWGSASDSAGLVGSLWASESAPGAPILASSTAEAAEADRSLIDSADGPSASPQAAASGAGGPTGAASATGGRRAPRPVRLGHVIRGMDVPAEFSPGSYRIMVNDERAMAELSEVIRKNFQYTVRVTGYASPNETSSPPHRLGRARALEVAKMLSTAGGFPMARVILRGAEETEEALRRNGDYVVVRMLRRRSRRGRGRRR